MTTPACRVCHNQRPEDLLRCTSVTTDRVSYCCRASVSAYCYRDVGPASVETIRLVVPPPPLTNHLRETHPGDDLAIATGRAEARHHDLATPGGRGLTGSASLRHTPAKSRHHTAIAVYRGTAQMNRDGA
jgi:hypothetical protein